MCDKPTDDRGGRDDLETVLTDINALAEVLLQIGESRDEETAHYLGSRLREHYKAADDAFNRIFGIGEYAEKSGEGDAA